MKHAVYPGSFDPCTNGHVDIIRRASSIFDKVTIGVLSNSAKKPLFSVDERVKILKEVTKDFPNVAVDSFSGLAVDFVRLCDANIIIRGLRAITDFEYELQLAQTNRELAPDIDTAFLMADLQYAYLSSTTVKEVAAFGQSVDRFVPPIVARMLAEKYEEKVRGM